MLSKDFVTLQIHSFKIKKYRSNPLFILNLKPGPPNSNAYKGQFGN